MSDLANTPVAALLELAASQLEVAAHSTNSQMETLASSIGALVMLGAELQAAQWRRRGVRTRSRRKSSSSAQTARGGDAVP